jgi:tRNA A37 threonylcarbamoyladenosine synthetase subunit TsaC/SUA5/YrdC
VADVARAGGIIAYPTDSCLALGANWATKPESTGIRSIRHLDDRHHFALVCQDFAQLNQIVHINHAVFRAIKASPAATPSSSR